MNLKITPWDVVEAVGGPKSMGFVMEQETAWVGWSVLDSRPIFPMQNN